MANTTPGEIAYEAYCQFWGRQGLSERALFAWNALTREMQTAWEAAAQAVRAMEEEKEDSP